MNKLALCRWLAVGAVVSGLAVPGMSAELAWLEFPGGSGPGQGKHVVLVSGDEEYRSEEALPQLAKILARRLGFQCTVLFAIDPADGTINPNVRNNIPGLEALDGADLLVLFTRFRELPDEQMKHIVDYVEAGKPIVATCAPRPMRLTTKKSEKYGATPGKTRSGRGALGARCWARRGSTTMASTASKAPADWWPHRPPTIQSWPALRTGISGGRPMSTAYDCRFRMVARHSCWDRCYRE